VVARCAARHKSVHLVDLHALFLGHGFACDHFWSKHYDAKDPHLWYSTNVEDPNDRGYDAIRRAFLLEVARVFQAMP
jgi:hypothetical protein